MSIQIPNYLHTQMVDEKGYPTETWALLFSQLLSQLQGSLSNEGFIIPAVTEDILAKLDNSQNGTILYNSTTNQLVVNINGTFKNVSTS